MKEEVSAGAAIRERRKDLGLSQAELAERIGVHRVQVTRIENGTRRINLRYAHKLADVLGWEVVRRAIEGAGDVEGGEYLP